MKSSGNKKLSRKKFLVFGVAVSALLGIPAFLQSRFKAKNKTVRMLTEDGKLVEVDATLLPSKKEKLALTDIRTWVHKKISSP